MPWKKANVFGVSYSFRGQATFLDSYHSFRGQATFLDSYHIRHNPRACHALHGVF